MESDMALIDVDADRPARMAAPAEDAPLANLSPITLATVIGGADLAGGIHWFCTLRD